ncbi:MAG: metallophosphoesterase family protein [Anaerolineae bacterium]
MDKIAVISDVHGNIPALEAVLADIRQRGIDLIYNLGDLVGKGPGSDLVIDRCREVCHTIVRGNWDQSLIDDANDPALAWYRDQIGEQRLAYLQSLPNVIDFWLSGKRVRLFHASPAGVYTRVRSWDTYELHLGMFANTPFTGETNPSPDIVGYGDIHVVYLLPLLLDNKTLFNVGSVGNPLDFPLATYAILTGVLDSQTVAPYTIEFARLPYDIELAVKQAQQVDLPERKEYITELRTAIYRRRQQSS